MVNETSWFDFSDSQCAQIDLCKIRRQPTFAVSFRLTIYSDFKWELTHLGRIIEPTHHTLASIPQLLVTIEQVMSLVSLVDRCQICTGNTEDTYIESVKSSETTLAGTTGTY